MTRLWSFDFGETSGISLGRYTSKTAYELSNVWEVQGGAEGFLKWCEPPENVPFRLGDTIVAERFVLNPGEGTRFIPNIAGVPAEGILMAFARSKIHWRLRTEKNVEDSILKEHGLWQGGKQTNHDDGRDANDTIKHALGHLRDSYHLPTLKEYFRA